MSIEKKKCSPKRKMVIKEVSTNLSGRWVDVGIRLPWVSPSGISWFDPRAHHKIMVSKSNLRNNMIDTKWSNHGITWPPWRSPVWKWRGGRISRKVARR